MRKLGIALYPDKTELIEDQAYLKMVKDIGYERVFMSFLQIDVNNPMRSIQRIKESAKLAHDMGFSVTLDIHPMVFTYLKCKEDDLSYFHAMGIDVLRLDKGYDGYTEAMMSHNPYGVYEENRHRTDSCGNGITCWDTLRGKCHHYIFFYGTVSWRRITEAIE